MAILLITKSLSSLILNFLILESVFSNIPNIVVLKSRFLWTTFILLINLTKFWSKNSPEDIVKFGLPSSRMRLSSWIFYNAFSICWLTLITASLVTLEIEFRPRIARISWTISIIFLKMINSNSNLFLFNLTIFYWETIT